VIIADEDLLCAFLDRPSLNGSRKYLPIDPAHPVSRHLVTSKHSFVENADALGLPVPRYRFATTCDDAEVAAAEIGYPVILKGDRGFAGLQVRRATDAAGVRRYARRFLKTYSRVLVQQEIVGEPVSACAVYDRGRLSALKSFRAECEYPRTFSPSTVHGYFAHSTIENVVTRLGEVTGFHGLAGVDFMYDASANEIFVIEFNPRPTIGFGGASANRAFFAEALKRLLYQKPLISAEIYDGKEDTQAYFPSYIFYLVGRAKRYDSRTLRRLRLCLSEFRRGTLKIVIWEFLRFIAGRFKWIAAAIPALPSKHW
jgi:carbamoylphosphate synthase large subunit